MPSFTGHESRAHRPVESSRADKNRDDGDGNGLIAIRGQSVGNHASPIPRYNAPLSSKSPFLLSWKGKFSKRIWMLEPSNRSCLSYWRVIKRLLPIVSRIVCELYQKLSRVEVFTRHFFSRVKIYSYLLVPIPRLTDVTQRNRRFYRIRLK